MSLLFQFLRQNLKAKPTQNKTTKLIRNNMLQYIENNIIMQPKWYNFINEEAAFQR